MKRPALTALTAFALLAPCAAFAQTVRDPNFVVERIYRGNGMISIDFGPSGRLYVAEKVGRILTFLPDASGRFRTPTVFADLRAAISFEQESGLLGMVVDPDFANTRHMDLLYTTPAEQRIVRVEANATYDQMVPGSETVLLDGLPRAVPWHKAGDLQFHPHEPDILYASLGDDGAENAVQNPARYEGKILRISKLDGAGLPDNPFHAGDLWSIESRVWAVGFRNPFRFVFHPDPPVPDVLYTSENGNSTDRFSWVRRGSNGAWSASGDSGGFLSPPDPNHRVLGTVTPFLTGIAIAHHGPFQDPDVPNSDVLYICNPQEMNGAGAIRRYRLTGAELETAVPVARDNGEPFIVGAPGFDMAFGPDRALYLSQTNAGESGEGWYSLRRVRYISGAAPVAAFSMTPNPALGEAPLYVSFFDTSHDFDGSISTWSWSFGDGNHSVEPSPAHVYERPGNYSATLTVTDNSGLQSTATATISVFRAMTLTLTGQLRDGRDPAGAPLPLPTDLRLHDGDLATPLSFPGGGGPKQNAIDVPAGGVIDATVQLQLTGPELTIIAGLDSSPLRPAVYGFRVDPEANAHTELIDLALSSASISGRIRDTRGDPAHVDLGVSRASPGMLYAFAGGRDYLPSSSIPPTGIAHRTVSDELGYYYVPIAPSDVLTEFYADVVGDTGAMIYLPSAFSVSVSATAGTIADVTLGLQAGGAACDDLTALPEVPAIDYASQIQPIWEGACTGCHNEGSGNSGGLDLSTNSRARLVSVNSLEVPGRRLVEPGKPEESFLFEKINCASPQVGTRMRPTDAMPLEQQALIAAWIRQGALERPAPIPDAGISDSGRADSGAGSADAGVNIDASGGEESCACSAKTSGGGLPSWALMILVLWTVYRGRCRDTSASSSSRVTPRRAAARAAREVRATPGTNP